MTTTEIIAAIQAAAPLVAETRAELDEAIESERHREADVLDAAIRAAKPALRALSGRIVQSSYESAGRGGCNPVRRVEFFDESGVLLVNGYERRKDETGNRGELVGHRLYLLVSGELAETERHGSFSFWQGEADEWHATLSHRTAREVMAKYALDDCLTELRDALQKQLEGKASERAQGARERAARLAALALLAK